jgi:hypothetical protein
MLIILGMRTHTTRRAMDEPEHGVARVQIGRVKLKDGADLHIIRRAQTKTESGNMLRDWTAGVLNCPQHPDAVACVAFIWSPIEKRYMQSVLWWSDREAFPIGALPSMAKFSLESSITEQSTEATIMHNLGYRPVNPPDGAA